ncbi:MAG: carbamoyl phosphate synthase small subunit [Synergistes sp.]|nr:carbamoyl phosphate synthase small subunit [Synergistes sp.]
MKKEIYLTLTDGTVYKGYGETETPIEGELVFTTASCGYPQILTDPCHNGQIVVFAFPSVGIYGIDSENLEGRRIMARAAVVSSLDEPKNGRFESLSDWSKKNSFPLISGIDTRQLILKIRKHDSITARIDFEPNKPVAADLNDTLVSEVSCKEVMTYGEGSLTVALIDYGVKESMIRSMTERKCRVLRFPNTASAEEILASGADGIMLSSGPGDPAVLTFETEQISKLLGKKTIMGVCMGNELLARACGASTKKMPFSHTGGNLPVVDLATGSGLVTAQNHRYAVDESTLSGTGLEVAYRHLGDGTIEGLTHIRYDAFSVQFHPEAAGWREDASYIYDNFVTRMQAAKEMA